ncbi:MAG: Cache 3/Cache 2 fusion domain-containing protein, partial [Desulfobulbaceae bacterium]|nr:Cache 3/Cache 2 fusion domain-containing protein [Desulfobulbaceae bacterium]
MSSHNKSNQKNILPYSRFWSVRSFFLLVMSGITVFMCLLLLWSGLTIMNSLIYQFGTEILTEKLNTLIHSIDSRYASIISSEDGNSSIHLQEIKNQTLENLARFRYKDSGEVFVIHRDKTILISKDFKNQDDKNFAAFYNLLQREKEILQYRSGTDNKLAVFRYYRPWESFIGISINRQELFALTNLYRNL